MTQEFSRKVGLEGHVLAMPRPAQAELDTFYAKEYYGNDVTATYSANYTDKELAQKRLRAECTIEAVSQATDGRSIRALEVGCGEGFVLAAAKARGWNIKGVDYQSAPIEKFNPDCMDLLHAEDPNKHLERRIKDGAKFDAIVLQNVLEHVRDPEDLLKKLHQIISDDGVLLVQVPNDFSQLQALARETGRISRDYWWAPPQHLTYFNSEAIAPFMAAQGFEIVDGFTDFPIETFLWGGQSNYAEDTSLGVHAHSGRVELDLFFARSGLSAYLDLYRSFYRVGFGRNIVIVARKLNKIENSQPG